MKVNVKKISTESRNENTFNIDSLSSKDIAKLLNDEDKTVPVAIEKIIPEIAKAIDMSYEAIKSGGRIIYIGAGTSGRLGVLDASEMPPTYNVSNNLIIGLIAGGDEALRNPIEGAEDDRELIINDLKEINFNKNDVLIGIAASGRTPYVVSGIEYAKKIGAKTISLSTSKDSQIGQIVDIKLEPVTGPEPITGSTRMKSGTAQKLVLNMISTSVMIKLGKVYQNLMIDVKPSNEKLIERAINIVETITDCSRDEAINALQKCNNLPKIASIMILKNVGASDANILLEKVDGKLQEVLNGEGK